MSYEEAKDKYGVDAKRQRIIVLVGAFLILILALVVGFQFGYSKTKVKVVPVAELSATPSQNLQKDVSGVVIDKISEEPIKDAKITSGSQSTLSKADGSFRFKVADNAKQLDISAEGFQAVTADINEKEKITLSPKGEIIFVSNRDGKRGLYRVNLDGSQDKNLVPRIDDKEDFSPVISPRERYVAFLSTRDGRKDNQKNDNPALYLVKTDGSELKKISDYYDVRSVTWSPDGTYVAWVGRENQDSYDSKLAVYNVADKSTVYVGEGGDDIGDFSFSKDDSMVTFSIHNSGNSSRQGIYVADGNGNNSRKVSSATGSPKYNDDLNVEFTDYADNKTKYMAWFHDSGELKEIDKNDTKRVGTPSPDKVWIAYIENRDGKNNVFVSRPNKSGEKKLTSVDSATDPIRWTLDGKYITFRVSKQNESARYIVATSGKGSAKKIIDEYGAGEYMGY